MSNKKKIDINADLGEFNPDHDAYVDDQLMPYLSSCNIATGGHAGDHKSMHLTCQLAAEHGLKIGAHVSYEDKVHFGRISLDLTVTEIISQISKQLDVFEQVVKAMDLHLHHIKAHGALYHDLCIQTDLALAFCEHLVDRGFEGILYGRSDALLAQIAASTNISYWNEIFADRRYTANGLLQSRKIEGSVLNLPQKVKSQVEHWIHKGAMPITYGQSKKLPAQTICIHSDTPNAVTIAQTTRETFEANGYLIL